MTAATGDGGAVLLTGATGFVGMELLVRLLERTDREVIALVRAEDDEAAAARIDELLKTLIAPADRRALRQRVRGVAADIERPGLGLSSNMRDTLTASIGAVVHCAASISYTLELADARRINVGGTREVLRLAREARERGALDRVLHVSTAYVAGDRTGRALERDRDVGQQFRNTYERTKLEAEGVVLGSGLPAAIVRPSVIVGDSTTGWIPEFNVLYWTLHALALGHLDPIPGDADALIDIVPIDVVADALLDLLCGPVREGTFHVTAGDDAFSNERLAKMASRHFGVAAPRFAGAGQDPWAEMMFGPVAPYFKVHCVFDAPRQRELDARPPPLGEYFAGLMRYADDTRWGEQPVPRWTRVPEEATVRPVARNATFPFER